ncbi:MAG: peptide chain release factor 1 [Christensenellaceae bacterium]|nr:peptide chain release factor 1 [Christensenellaceae bacterium]
MYLEKLADLRARYEELEMRLSQPETVVNQELFRRLMREHASMGEIMGVYGEYKLVCEGIDQAREMLEDADLREMAKEELSGLEPKKEALEQRIQILLLPKDPNDERDVILEIRAGAGGDEAALFGAELLRMYSHYAESRGWQVEELDSSITELGGVKELSLLIRGQGAYSRLKYESGVHRVQRVPETEAGGRIHTSTTTVAVMPEVDDVEVEINPGDLRIDTYRAGGAGGQHVNRTDSAVRITHLPSGIVVQCQNERSQIQNREQAMRMLRSKLWAAAEQARADATSQKRKSQVGTGDRSERIRTYNYPQGRVSDHRIGLTLYKLQGFLQGDLDEMLDALTLSEQTARMEEEFRASNA